MICGLFASEFFLDPTPDDFDNAYFIGVTKPLAWMVPHYPLLPLYPRNIIIHQSSRKPFA